MKVGDQVRYTALGARVTSPPPGVVGGRGAMSDPIPLDDEQQAFRDNATEAQLAHVSLAAMTAAAAFRTRGWKWGHTDPAPPTPAQIEDMLWRLIGSAALLGQGSSSSSGRLCAMVGDEGDIDLSMDLGTLEHFISPELEKDGATSALRRKEASPE